MKEKVAHILIYKLAIVWSVFICIPYAILAQDNVFFDHLTTEDGLSQSDINSIYQDYQGFMWFATHDGLNKYDGYEFTVYSPSPNKAGSINSNLIFDIIGDKRGNLWIATTGSGLNYFDRTTEKFRAFRHHNENKRSLGDDHISTIFKDGKNRLWIGTNKGMNMLDLNKSLDSVAFHSFDFEPEPFSPNWDGRRIYSIFENSKNQLLVGGVGGLFVLSRDQNGDLYFKCINDDLGLTDVTVTSIAEDLDGRLIIGTIDGIYTQERNGKNDKFIKIFDGYFNDIIVDKSQNVWCGTNSGLLLFHNSSDIPLPKYAKTFTYNPLESNSISKNIIKSLTIDKTGIIWIGTNGGGVNKFDPERKQFDHIRKTLHPNSLSYDKIRSLFEDSNGTLWVGTEGGGLNMHIKANEVGKYDDFQTFDAISRAFAITETILNGKKTLFIGAEGTPALFELDITNPKNITESNIKPIQGSSYSVFALLTDSAHNIWIGTYGGGLSRWVPDKGGKAYQKTTFKEQESNASSISSNIIRNI